MRQLATVVVAAFALVGCTPIADPPPPPPTLTVEPTPTGPVFTEGEQAVIDAVHRYSARSEQIARDPVGSDWETIREVAWWPADDNAVRFFQVLYENGWHLEGESVFIPEAVVASRWDHQGQRYDVYGCLSVEGTSLVDSEGNRVGTQEFERGAYRFEVILTPDDQYFVTEDVSEKKEC